MQLICARKCKHNPRTAKKNKRRVFVLPPTKVGCATPCILTLHYIAVLAPAAPVLLLLPSLRLRPPPHAAAAAGDARWPGVCAYCTAGFHARALRRGRGAQRLPAARVAAPAAPILAAVCAGPPGGALRAVGAGAAGAAPQLASRRGARMVRGTRAVPNTAHVACECAE